ncbi:MAG TPA: WG repeat-containing protein, partial [Saprospiraceae bacterium]|nr:WG repeat-containing protein [Saprospiraceae bacterium]
MRISALFMLAAIVAAGFASCNKKATTETGDLKIVPYRNGDLWGFSDAKGNMLVEPKYSNAYLLDDGFGRIYQGESTGLVSPDGKVLAEPEYMYISMFKNGLAAFRNNNDTLSGYLNEQGQVAIPAQFEEANDFEDGYAIV